MKKTKQEQLLNQINLKLARAKRVRTLSKAITDGKDSTGEMALELQKLLDWFEEFGDAAYCESTAALNGYIRDLKAQRRLLRDDPKPPKADTTHAVEVPDRTATTPHTRESSKAEPIRRQPQLRFG